MVIDNSVIEESKNPPRVLIMEDDVSIQKFYKEILPHVGYNPTITRNYDEATEAYRASPGSFSAIITDNNINGHPMTGVDLAQKIRELDNRIPIIICSGRQDLVEEQMAALPRPLINIYYHPKPLNILQLAKSLDELLKYN